MQKPSSSEEQRTSGDEQKPPTELNVTESGDKPAGPTPSNDGSGMNSSQSPLKLAEAPPAKDGMIPTANPLLPKIVHPEQRQPPQCPLKDIQFVQLQRFRRCKQQLSKMGEGYDQIGKRGFLRE